MFNLKKALLLTLSLPLLLLITTITLAQKKPSAKSDNNFRHETAMKAQHNLVDSLILVSVLRNNHQVPVATLNRDSLFKLLKSTKLPARRITIIYQMINNGLGTSKEGLSTHYRILNWAIKNKDEIGEAVVSAELGYNYCLNGNNAEGFKLMFKALKIAQKTKNIQAKGIAYNNLGICYYSIGNFDLAKQYTVKAINFSGGSRDSLQLCYAFEQMGDVYTAQHRRDSAMYYMDDALKIAVKRNIRNQVSEILLKVGDMESRNEFKFKYYKAGKDIAIANRDTVNMANSFVTLADYFKQQNQTDSGMFYARQAVHFASKSSLTGVLRPTLLLAQLFEHHNADSALKYTRVYYTLRDSVNNIKKMQDAQAIGYIEQRREKEIENQKAAYQNNLRLSVLAVVIIFLILLSIIFLRNNRQVKAEKRRSDLLLLNILPADVAEELKEKGTAEAKLFNEVTVLFTDFVNFTTISELLSPQELVDELHHCFKAFDEIVTTHHIEKIKTIGDAYLAVSGLPNANLNHAANAVKAALEIQKFIDNRKRELGDKTFDIRIGIHSGSVVAGIVGVKKFAYDIWGDTVNTAARMEQNSAPGKINVSETTYELVKDKFMLVYRGEIEAKNKGALKMYYVEN